MKGWKTIIFNVVSIGIASLQAKGVIALLPPGSEAILPIVIAAGNIVLRHFTSTPVAYKA